ncbi:hypothetical protein SAMN05518801_101530 [Novosphingobium sp. CF614]|uniref:hypothetical protein n=1 Tax=Novosphingobium sp. CF614 TaxID=1884364 RepID=UPI0008ECD000|nr:hypothetical protein [Novosphingobium sp. CF614]SFF78813.1 hypothetical protein SAMN05518801_101530 [Novosphingobium sp. CF614]
MNERMRLVRYAVLAANRRHFEILFFAVAAFSSTYALAVGIALFWMVPELPTMPQLAAGGILNAGGLVAHRLLRRERSCLDSMRKCWNAASGDVSASNDASFRPGAMAIIVVGLHLLGTVLLAWMFGQTMLQWRSPA